MNPSNLTYLALLVAARSPKSDSTTPFSFRSDDPGPAQWEREKFGRHRPLDLREIRSGGATLNVNKPNQDARYSDPKSRSDGVSDGAGRYGKGHIASAMAMDYIQQALRRPGAILDGMSPEKVGEIMIQAFQGANRLIYETDPNMRATATVNTTIQFEGKIFAVIVSIGDSGAFYLPKGGNELEHITNNAGNEKEQKWYLNIQKQIANLKTFTNPPAHLQPYVKERHGFFEALGGHKERKPSVYIREVKRGDILVLKTDGTSNLTDEELTAILIANSSSDPEEIANNTVYASHKKDEDFLDQFRTKKRQFIKNLPAERQHPLGLAFMDQIELSKEEKEELNKIYYKLFDDFRATLDDRTVNVTKYG